MTFREVIITPVSVIQKSYLSYYKRLSQRGMYTKFSFSSFFYAFLVALTGRGEIEIRRIMQTCQAGEQKPGSSSRSRGDTIAVSFHTFSNNTIT